ncbi:mechanosensitive ion channel [Oscillatoriales cyanobacterium LEGE 11467]|uniref:Mechanosensitive ion channel n=1 Tax=Zarconia navalis LEGE 11467 TaxID=1828826 RepID=A0A928Z7N0_9CYAN|nr:mechanosensitive ion channel [Zarconia navalis]MBE9039863.1 mechanosensitive ion channel [Zarconia navalis LEGE 11467]
MTHIRYLTSMPDWLGADRGELLAQTNFSSFFNNLGSTLGEAIPRLIGAIVILVAFWLGALLAATLVKGLLDRTNLDNKIARWLSGSQQGADYPIEQWASQIVFWIILLFGLVAFLNALGLQFVSGPIGSFLETIFEYLPKVGGALLLLGLAWVLATLAKTLLIRLLAPLRLDDRLAAESGGESPFVLSETLGNAVYWFIFLFFLTPILDTLELEGPLGPVQNLLDQILSALPRVLEALIIGAIGWFVARIVRGIVTNLLSATGADRLGSRFGLSSIDRNTSLSGIAGTIVYVLVLIPTAIAALNALQIEAISEPAIAMLEQVLEYIPRLFAASAILAVFYVIGRFVSDFVTSILTSLGFNSLPSVLGLSSLSETSARPTALDEDTTTLQSRTPSEFVGIIAWVGVILLGLIAAVEALQFEALSVIVSGLLVILGRILVGLTVFAIGLYLANFAYSLIASSGSSQSQLLGQATRVTIIIFVAAMALQSIGVAPDIVNLAFGLLLGAIAVAIALAFGLGGRDIAAEQTRIFLASFKQKTGTRSTGKSAQRQAPRSTPEI